MKRRILSAALAITLLFPLSVSASSGLKSIEVYPNTINIKVNGQPVTADNFLYNNTTYVPLRAVSEMLGAKVDWYSENNLADITRSDSSYESALVANAAYIQDLLSISLFINYAPDFVAFAEKSTYVMAYGLDGSISYTSNDISSQAHDRMISELQEIKDHYSALRESAYNSVSMVSDQILDVFDYYYRFMLSLSCDMMYELAQFVNASLKGNPTDEKRELYFQWYHSIKTLDDVVHGLYERLLIAYNNVVSNKEKNIIDLRKLILDDFTAPIDGTDWYSDYLKSKDITLNCDVGSIPRILVIPQSLRNNNNVPVLPNNVTSLVTNSFPYHLYSNDGKVYLGKLVTDDLDDESIWYKFSGDYSWKYSDTSIWHEYGDYGSKYSDKSAFNDMADEPPIIVDGNGKFVAYLTTNERLSPRYTISELRQFLINNNQ